jgi:Fe-S cluster assembly iron-binding protein IscA
VQLTDDAATMIVDLVQQRALPDGAGLRIAPRPDHRALAMSLAEAAAPEDVVVETDRARVFLAPVAHRRLAGAVLDARRNRSGSAFFVRP